MIKIIRLDWISRNRLFWKRSKNTKYKSLAKQTLHKTCLAWKYTPSEKQQGHTYSPQRAHKGLFTPSASSLELLPLACKLILAYSSSGMSCIYVKSMLNLVVIHSPNKGNRRKNVAKTYRYLHVLFTRRTSHVNILICLSLTQPHICVYFLSSSCYCLAVVCTVFSSIFSTFYSVACFPVVKQ